MNIPIVQVKRKLAKFIVVFSLFFYGPIILASLKTDESPEYFPGVIFSIWALTILFGNLFYQLNKLEKNNIQSPINLQQNYIIFGGKKGIIIMTFFILLPIILMIVHAIFT